MKRRKTIKPDNKGRVHLGKLTDGISSFSIEVDKDHRIILEPLVEIPAREKWLFNNKSALESVKKGLQEAKEKDTHDLGSFKKYLDEDEV